jgi:hypothetical protein
VFSISAYALPVQFRQVSFAAEFEEVMDEVALILLDQSRLRPLGNLPLNLGMSWSWRALRDDGGDELVEWRVNWVGKG